MQRQGKYVSNKKNGVWTEYAQNGHILSKGKYANDMKEGKWVFYNMHEKVVREQNFVHDVPEGAFTEYYDNGVKHTQGGDVQITAHPAQIEDDEDCDDSKAKSEKRDFEPV